MSDAPPVLPPWPEPLPTYGRVLLRPVDDRDVSVARDLSRDPAVPLTSSLPPEATIDEARAWVRRQRARYAEGTGFSMAIVNREAGESIGHCGLWLGELPEDRASAGYALVPAARGRGLAVDALIALTRFAWTVPGLFRVALFIEPRNVASLRTAERAGYLREGLLRSHHEIGGERRDMYVYPVVRE